MCGGGAHSILLLPLVARYLETIDVCIWRVFVFISIVVVVVCLPRPMEGMGQLQFSDLFFTELPVPPHAAGVVGTFNVLDIYPSEHYGLSFFGPYGCHFFYKVSFLPFAFFLCTLQFFWQVHFACVLCI